MICAGKGSCNSDFKLELIVSWIFACRKLDGVDFEAAQTTTYFPS